VCTEPSGDISRYLKTPNTLGQFRSLWEPRWNEAVDGFRRGAFTGDHKFVLSLGWASIMATTPKMTGIGAEILEQELRALLPIIARDRPPPPSIHLENIAFDVDPKFAQALFIQGLPRIAWRLYLQPWTLLTNATTDPFLVSDNPAAKFGENNLGLPPAALLPIAPDMCVTTLMDFKLVVPRDLSPIDMTTKPCGEVSPTAAALEQARFINTLIVKHAAELVFSSSNSADVAALVAALRHLGVKLDHSVTSIEDGRAMMSLARTGIGTVK
jgi:hypothetical protein